MRKFVLCKQRLKEISGLRTINANFFSQILIKIKLLILIKSTVLVLSQVAISIGEHLSLLSLFRRNAFFGLTLITQDLKIKISVRLKRKILTVHLILNKHLIRFFQSTHSCQLEKGHRGFRSSSSVIKFVKELSGKITYLTAKISICSMKIIWYTKM